MWEDRSSHACTEKREFADLVDGKIRIDLGIDDEGSSQSYDEGGMANKGDHHVPKSSGEATNA